MSVYEHPELKQEDDRVPVARIAAVMVFVVLFSVALALAAYIDDHVREGHLSARGAAPTENRIGPATALPPHVLTQPGEGRALEVRQREALGSYGWTDRARGLVHIPIDRAIDLWFEHAGLQP